MQQTSFQTCRRYATLCSALSPVLSASHGPISSCQQPVGTDHGQCEERARQPELNLRFVCATFNYLRMLAPDVGLGCPGRRLSH